VQEQRGGAERQILAEQAVRDAAQQSTSGCAFIDALEAAGDIRPLGFMSAQPQAQVTWLHQQLQQACAQGTELQDDIRTHEHDLAQANTLEDALHLDLRIATSQRDQTQEEGTSLQEKLYHAARDVLKLQGHIVTFEGQILMLDAQLQAALARPATQGDSIDLRQKFDDAEQKLAQLEEEFSQKATEADHLQAEREKEREAAASQKQQSRRLHRIVSNSVRPIC
jgi:chromosome segregation ATPase